MRPASQSEAGQSDALLCMSVTELTSQLDRSELKEEAQLNTARQGARKPKDSVLASKDREVIAPPIMLVTLLTSQRERSRLKSEHR